MAVDLHYPFRGRWTVQNSPANRVPSHGTTGFGSSHAIDFVPLARQGRGTAPFTWASLIRAEDPSLFPGFGREILAPHDGVVVVTHDGAVDHPAHRGFPSIRYALTQGDRAREGWRSLAGNHVMIDVGPAIIVLCHLQQGSVGVSRGVRIRAGDTLARCGNSGNSTEPHLHVQAVDRADVEDSPIAVPMTFRGSLDRNGAVIDAG
ncbi:M23 family metallopeptidase [Microbacterium sp. G2-8]|uniref:M23 family metallopeptidase n=1 Tax=Microbacterium sp. G2-8 TaxID=2842454 RepID=UPI001C8A6751|nr:M23 family metallopeptidase [Microbacterium sp. G2-8]